MEILRDDITGECFLIEINARPWVQLGLAHKAGLDFLGFVLGRADAQGVPASPRPLRWLNFEADVYGCLSRDIGAVRRGRLTLNDYLRSFFAANTFAVWGIPPIRSRSCVACRKWSGIRLGVSHAVVPVAVHALQNRSWKWCCQIRPLPSTDS